MISEISARQRDHRATIQAYLQAVFTLALPTGDASSWHLPGERGVINKLVRIQSEVREDYRRLARLVADRSEPGNNATGSCLAGIGGPSETG